MARPVLAALDVEATVELDGMVYWVGGWNQTCPLWAPNTYNPEREALFATCTYFNASQPSNASLRPNTTAFQYVSHSALGPITAPFNYTRARHASTSAPWPPLGIHLAIKFEAPASAPPAIKAVEVTVHYELLQGIPAMTKWVEISAPPCQHGQHGRDNAQEGHAGGHPGDIEVGNVVVETLRVNDDYAWTSYGVADGWRIVGSQASRSPPLLFAEVDTPTVRIAPGARGWRGRTMPTPIWSAATRVRALHPRPAIRRPTPRRCAPAQGSRARNVGSRCAPAPPCLCLQALTSPCVPRRAPTSTLVWRTTRTTRSRHSVYVF